MFGVWIIRTRICCILFDLYVTENKKEGERRKKKIHVKNNKIEIFTFNFLNCEED